MGGQILETDSPEIAASIKAQALALGFDLVGIAAAGTAETFPAFQDWLAEGHGGTMQYLDRLADMRADTRLPVSGARSIVVVGMNYGGRQPSGPVARYARGDDYHDVMRDRLTQLHGRVEAIVGQPVSHRAFVDTGPILERDLARKAGLGWFGKNTNLINPDKGSFFFIGCLLLGIDLAIDAPFEQDRCGSCTRCLDACPTDALIAPRVLDATQCISYLTIEFRGDIPVELRAKMGDLLYGCDICQEVCPWNVKFAEGHFDQAYAPRAFIGSKTARELALDILALDVDGYREAFRNSPMKRAKLGGLQRNAAVTLGNVGSLDDAPALIAALCDEAAMVRSHAAWALGRIGCMSGAAALRERLVEEPDAGVREEIASALRALSEAPGSIST